MNEGRGGPTRRVGGRMESQGPPDGRPGIAWIRFGKLGSKRHFLG